MQRTPQSYSPAERARIMSAVRRGLEVGRRVGVTARECGITEALYYRWVREQGRGIPEVSPAGSASVGRAQDGTALADENRSRANRRRGPLPTDLRDRLQIRAIALREEDGLPLDLIAERLGVSQATVVRWLARRSQEAGFVQVEVVANVPEPAPVVPVLLAPGGYRVEGLDVAGLAELLRRLA
jgi:transposase-like protein